jgi:hypothetical protein
MLRIVCVVIAAVMSAAPAAGQAGQDADAKEISSYRLTMDVVNKVAAATRVMITELKKDPKFQEAAEVDAEIEAIEKKETTTEADDARLEKLNARKEELSKAMEGLSMGDADTDTLSDMEARIRQVPALMAGLRAASLTPRDYAKFTMAALQAGMVAGLKKQGVLKEVPKDVSAENVKFIEEHEAELRALQKEWAALGGEEK